MINNPKPKGLFPLSKYITNPNIYNNERWVHQQEALFTVILNDVLEPASTGLDSLWSDDAFEGLVESAFDLYQSDEFHTIRTRLLNVRIITF